MAKVLMFEQQGVKTWQQIVGTNETKRMSRCLLHDVSRRASHVSFDTDIICSLWAYVETFQAGRFIAFMQDLCLKLEPSKALLGIF